MKKIITILFFAGFLTTASFAQQGHRQQNNTQANSKEYSLHQNSRNNHDYHSKNSRNGDYMDNHRHHRRGGHMRRDHSYRNHHSHGLFHRRFDRRDRD